LVLQEKKNSCEGKGENGRRSGERERAWTTRIGIIVTWKEQASDTRRKVRDKDIESGRYDQIQTLKEEER
jgi:hypothetical protein